MQKVRFLKKHHEENGNQTFFQIHQRFGSKVIDRLQTDPHFLGHFIAAKPVEIHQLDNFSLSIRQSIQRLN